MKKKLTSLLSIMLAVALLLGCGFTVLRIQRIPPDNPITDTDSTLRSAVWNSSGSLGTEQENEKRPDSEDTLPEPPKKEPEKQESSEKEDIPDPDEKQESSKKEDIPDPDEKQPGKDDGKNPGDSSEEGGEGGNAGDNEGNEEPTEPVIATNLGKFAVVTQDQLPDGLLCFFAYGTGGENLSVRVNVKPKNSISTGTWLDAENGQNFSWQLELGVTYSFTLYLYQGEERISYAVFNVTWQAKLADENNPIVGPEPLVIKTNIDDYGSEIKDENLPLIVTVYQNEKMEKIVTADKIRVTLNGETVQKHGGDSSPEYDLHFERPNVGDEKVYKIEIVAWYGINSTYWSKTLVYHATAEGDITGTVKIVLDATTVGCGILDSETYDIVQGDTAADVVLRFLEEYGYESTYDGSSKNAFYLRRISRWDMCSDAEIDEHLWEMILRDGINLNSNTHSRDSLGEYDYTMGSGWMYAVNGSYPGRAMSNYYLKDGDTLYLRFTLAYGKDIGGYSATGGGYGSLSGYCGTWIGGKYTPQEHKFVEVDRKEPTEDEDGYIDERCSRCGEEKHTVLPALGPGDEDLPPGGPGDDDLPPGGPGDDDEIPPEGFRRKWRRL